MNVPLPCPFCNETVLILSTKSPPQTLKLRCPRVTCHRRLTIYHGEKTVCRASKKDAEADGLRLSWDLTSFEGTDTATLRQMHEQRLEALQLVTASEMEWLSRLGDHIRRRGEESRRRADAYQKVEAAAEAVAHKKIKESDDSDSMVRIVLTKMIKKKIDKGALTHEEGAKLLDLTRTEMGCRKLAEKFGLDL